MIQHNDDDDADADEPDQPKRANECKGEYIFMLLAGARCALMLTAQTSTNDLRTPLNIIQPPSNSQLSSPQLILYLNIFMPSLVTSGECNFAPGLAPPLMPPPSIARARARASLQLNTHCRDSSWRHRRPESTSTSALGWAEEILATTKNMPSARAYTQLVHSMMLMMRPLMVAMMMMRPAINKS